MLEKGNVYLLLSAKVKKGGLPMIGFPKMEFFSLEIIYTLEENNLFEHKYMGIIVTVLGGF